MLIVRQFIEPAEGVLAILIEAEDALSARPIFDGAPAILCERSGRSLFAAGRENTGVGAGFRREVELLVSQIVVGKVAARSGECGIGHAGSFALASRRTSRSSSASLCAKRGCPSAMIERNSSFHHGQDLIR